MTKVSLTELFNLLTLGVVNFEYIKLSDNSLRKAKGTLCSREIPSNIDVSGIKIENNTLKYYDLEKNGWRTVAGTDIAAQLTASDNNSVLKVIQNKKGIITHAVLIDLLHTNIVKFKYFKPTGEERIAYGTTDPSRLPQIKETNVITAFGHVPYYNIETKSWKTVSSNSQIELIDFFDVPLKK